MWSGLTHTQICTRTNTHLLSHSYTRTVTQINSHVYTLFLRKFTLLKIQGHTQTHTRTGLVLPALLNWNTQSAVCCMVSLDSGWKEALLSTPVFAAVIRGASYFWAPIVHALTHSAKHTESALKPVCSSLHFLQLESVMQVASFRWPVKKKQSCFPFWTFRSSSWFASSVLYNTTDTKMLDPNGVTWRSYAFSTEF